MGRRRQATWGMTDERTRLDEAAQALLASQRYFRAERYRERVGLPDAVARHRLYDWCGRGLLELHKTGCPPHYTCPGNLPVLGREARWRLVAQPMLQERGWLSHQNYLNALVRHHGTVESYLFDARLVQRDISAWCNGKRLQPVGPQGTGRIYIPGGIDPADWQPRVETLDGQTSRLHRWALARQVIERDGMLTLHALSETAHMSMDTVQKDCAAWVTEGLLERHGVGTAIYWRFPGQGPVDEHAPERLERVERVIAGLSQWGALSAEDAAELLRCNISTARRDLNAAVLAGKAVRVKIGGRNTVWVASPPPRMLDAPAWAGEALARAGAAGEYEGRAELLEQWQWNALRRALPVTAGAAAVVWSIERPATTQRLAVLEAAGLLRRIWGGRCRPDVFSIAVGDDGRGGDKGMGTQGDRQRETRDDMRFAISDQRGQMVVAAVLLVMIVVLVAGGAVDVYRLQEARSWAYRTAEAAALAGATLGRDLSAVYTTGQPRVDPVAGYAAAEQTLLETLGRRGAVGATYDIRVIEWGGETIAGFPPVPRADMWGANDWTSAEPAVGVYLEMPVKTFLLGFVTGDEVAVHAFAAAGVSSPQ